MQELFNTFFFIIKGSIINEINYGVKQMVRVEDLHTFINGNFVTDKDAVIPIHDGGFTRGDAVFDTCRTFRGEIYKLEEHIDRLFMSLKYMQINSPYTKDELIEFTHKLLELNNPLLTAKDDYWIFLRITRGSSSNYSSGGAPNVIIHCVPLPLPERSEYYRTGLPLMISSVRRTSHEALSPRAKVNQYINFNLADLEAQNYQGGAKAILLDQNGNLTEGSGTNIFIVKNNQIFTPQEKFVLAGIGRSDAMNLAKGLGMPVKEKDLDSFDAFTADEMFVTSTSFCIVPVGSINGREIGDGDIPGKITKRLQEAFIDAIGFDYVSQYLSN
jgi:branched-chain amino acid aminotransferase